MGANVLDVYRLGPDKSILDNVWRSKVLRRPVYATSTEGSITQVWRIEAHGALVRIAAINWSARSVAVGEVVKRLEDAVVKSKGFFQSGSVDGTGLGRDSLNPCSWPPQVTYCFHRKYSGQTTGDPRWPVEPPVARGMALHHLETPEWDE